MKNRQKNKKHYLLIFGLINCWTINLPLAITIKKRYHILLI